VRQPSARRGPASLVALLLIAALLAACGEDDGGSPAQGAVDGDTTVETVDPDDVPEGGEITYAADQEPSGWNINTSKDNLLALGQMTQLVYPSVFRYDPDLEVYLDEDLMESAELVSEDPQVVEYVIRDEAAWDDGTPISIDDFVYKWENHRGTDEEIDVASTTGYEDIESVEGSDDGKTVTVTFARPFADWQSLFDQILPAHIVPELEGGWNAGLDELPEFSGGPFRFDGYQPEQSVNLVPNEEYWGDPPRVDRIVVRFGIEDAALPQALANEEIDLAYPQPQLDLVAQVDNLDGIDSQINYGPSFEHIDFNFENTLLAELEVRQAIALALDRDDIVASTVAQFDERGERLDNRIYLNTFEQYQANGEEYHEQDLERAQEILEEAGFDQGDDGIYERDGERLSFRISTTGGNQLREDTQQVIQDQLADAGIEITIDNLEGAAVFSKIFPDPGEDKDFDIALFAWVGTPFPATSSKALYTPDGGSNPTGYENERIAEIYDEAVRTTDEDEVEELMNEVDQILWDDVVTIPLYQKPTFLPHRDTLVNIVDNPSTAGPLWNARTWGVQAQ
jgi:peptide/nickel transport system substrate-binding protein